jgi:hypothetical protein
MMGFSEDVLVQAEKQKEVEFTTFGRKTGRERRVIVWISTDGMRLFIRSGAGLGRDWPKNLLAGGTGILHLKGYEGRVRGRHIEDPAEARQVSGYVRAKYGEGVARSAVGEPLTPGEQATFELVPA